MTKTKLKSILLTVISIFLISADPYQETLPNQAYVSGVVGHGQSYGLSCESRSAADLANFWGVSVTETEFLNSLPSSDNPEVGFVGNVNDPWGYIPPKSYGVHAQPVAASLQKYGLDALAHKGMLFSDLKAEIAEGRPVIVWVIGGVWSGTPQTYTANDGTQTIVAKYEHTMLMIGYDTNYVYLIDAGSGLTQTHKINNFINSWEVLGSMAVTARPSGQNPTTTPAQQYDEDSYVVKSGDYLGKIANEIGMTWQDLAAINNIYYPYIIVPGQVLITNPNSQASIDPTPIPSPTITATLEPDPTESTSIQPTQIPEPSPTITPTQTTQPDNPKTYTVKSGDHLMQIARNLQLNWEAMAKMNGLTSPYTLQPGQVLILPGPEAGPPPPPLDPDSPILSSTPIPQTGTSGKTYIVQKGEYIVSIARKLGLNWQSLASINNLSYPYLVYPGQELILP